MNIDDRAEINDSVFLVSSCILGIPTRWDGNECLADALVPLAAEGRVLPYCAEVTGGLSIPRGDASIQAYDGSQVLFKRGSTVDGHDVLDGRARVVTSEGVDVTEEYVRGAERGLELVKEYGITTAILKAYSPSCGSQKIYDGTFTLTLKPGQGVLAALLSQHGVTIYSENNVQDLLERLS